MLETVQKPAATKGGKELQVASWLSADIENAEEILLVDEVDVFFGNEFYGRTHNQVAPIEGQEVEDLLREIWQHRDKVAQMPQMMEQVTQCASYKALLRKFPDFIEIVQSEAIRMCADLKDHLANPKDYIFDGHRIGYKVMDGVAFDVVKGYKTAFAYLQEASKQPLPNEDATLRKALVMPVPCGRFSYAKLGSAKILGVSGTVEKLDTYEWQVMRQFGIKSYTVVPSVYGKNNFAFMNQTSGVPIMISKDQEHFYDISNQAKWPAQNKSKKAPSLFERVRVGLWVFRIVRHVWWQVHVRSTRRFRRDVQSLYSFETSSMWKSSRSLLTSARSPTRFPAALLLRAP